MSKVVVNISGFYKQFPQFNVETYTQICPAALGRSQIYISTTNGKRLYGEKRVLAIYLLTAHISLLTYNLQQGTNTAGTTGLVASASVDGVSTSFVQIPNMNKWDMWLALTPYGNELLFLMENLTAVPIYETGSLERVF